jgi:hypothetical protein
MLRLAACRKAIGGVVCSAWIEQKRFRRHRREGGTADAFGGGQRIVLRRETRET